MGRRQGGGGTKSSSPYFRKLFSWTAESDPPIAEPLPEHGEFPDVDASPYNILPLPHTFSALITPTLDESRSQSPSPVTSATPDAPSTTAYSTSDEIKEHTEKEKRDAESRAAREKQATKERQVREEKEAEVMQPRQEKEFEQQSQGREPNSETLLPRVEPVIERQPMLEAHKNPQPKPKPMATRLAKRLGRALSVSRQFRFDIRVITIHRCGLGA